MKTKSLPKDRSEFSKKVKRLNNRMIFLSLLFVPLILICAYLVPKSFANFVFGGIMVFFVIVRFDAMLGYQSLPCPKCGRKYFSGYWTQNVFRKQCSKCGFKMP